jgi:hypothetical protein
MNNSELLKQKQPLPAIRLVQLLSITAFTLLSLMVHYTALAQPPVGLKVGVGWSNPHVAFSQGPYNEYSSPDGGRYGMIVGLTTQVPLKAGWWLKPAVQFAWKGFFENYSSFGGYNYQVGNTMNYLEVPLNVIYTTRLKGTGFQVGGGPVISYLLNSNFRNYALRRTDVGFNVVTGYQTAIGFAFNLSYTHGLGDLVKNETTLSSLKNRFLGLTVGYFF